MDVVFGLIPMMLLFGFLVVVVFIWMAKSGQFDDLDGAANSIFMDDEFEDELKQKDLVEPADVKTSATKEMAEELSDDASTLKKESLRDEKQD